MYTLFFQGPYLQEAPVITDKPEIVYVMENQSVSITVTLNHVNAAVIWKRYCFTPPLHICQRKHTVQIGPWIVTSVHHHTDSPTYNWFVIWPLFLRRGVVLACKPGLYEMAMPDDDQHMLKLLKVKSADIGEMRFVASNKYGSDSCTFNVEMAGRQ